MKRCRYAAKYKAIRAPMCGGFDGPCDMCADKWRKKIEKMGYIPAGSFKPPPDDVASIAPAKDPV